MAIIHLYDVTGDEKVQLKHHLDSSGHELKFSDEPLSLESIDPEAEIVSVFIPSQVDAAVLSKMPKLKLIAVRSTGYDNIDLAAAKDNKVVVVNVPSYGEHTVAEYSFALLLALTRKIIQANQAFNSGDALHDELVGSDLYGKVLGVVGCGHIGRNGAQIGVGFGMKVNAYDLHQDETWAKTYGVVFCELDKLLTDSDIVSLHLPYSKAVHHLIDATKLNQMKPQAILVNTARGELVDTAALVEALGSKTIAGAALDVFEGENLVDVHNELSTLRLTGKQTLLREGLELDILRKLPNVIITNHNAFNTVEAIARINQITAENILAFVGGKTQNSVPSE